MITDPQPRSEARRKEYDRSDALVTMPLPPAETIQALASVLADAMNAGETAPVRTAGAALLASLSNFYRVPIPPLRVLGVRPHRVTQGICTYQLFGDYTPATQRIRVWMRTAIRERVSSPRALLNTLLHEFCHHLDSARLAMPQSYHTRGFFWRIDHLYHLALATPLAARKPLHWIKRGSVWMIDWNRLRPSAPRTASRARGE
ncbi:MAG TPA: hypothetical protein VKQ32_14275 [Polyangia bacterium]|nr:hypothetical protein [Polyangia bacterium]